MIFQMLPKLIEQLYQDLELGTVPTLDEQRFYPVKIGPIALGVKGLEPGYYFFSNIGPLPTKKREEFLTHAMKANFLGQGTGGASLGLQEDESSLTLSLSLPYEMNYNSFKDSLEEFVNFVDYWKKELVKHEIEAEKA